MNYFETLITLPRVKDINSAGLVVDLQASLRDALLIQSTPFLDEVLGFDRQTGDFSTSNIHQMVQRALLRKPLSLLQPEEFLCYMDIEKWIAEFEAEVYLIYTEILPIFNTNNMIIDLNNMFKDYATTENNDSNSRDRSVDISGNDERYFDYPQFTTDVVTGLDTLLGAFKTDNGEVDLAQTISIPVNDDKSITYRTTDKAYDTSSNEIDKRYTTTFEANKYDLINKKASMINFSRMYDTSIWDRLEKFFHNVGVGYEYN